MAALAVEMVFVSLQNPGQIYWGNTAVGVLKIIVVGLYSSLIARTWKGSTERKKLEPYLMAETRTNIFCMIEFSSSPDSCSYSKRDVLAMILAVAMLRHIYYAAI